MVTVIVNNKIEIGKWRALLKSQFSSPFQTPEFYNAINKTSSASANVYAIEDNREIRALAVIILYKERGVKSFFSRRAILYGGPLIKNATKKEFEFFLKSIEDQLRQKALYIEIRNFFNYSQFNYIFKALKWRYLPYINIQIDINGKNLEEVIKGFKYNRRREIKQSINSGAIYKECFDYHKIKEVYSILKETYKERVKLPLPPMEYFEHLIKENVMKSFVVTHEYNVIGGAFCLILPSRGIFTYYYCGIRNYHKKIFPTHLAIMAALEYAINTKIPLFDFMGAGKRDEEYGVRSYKKAFGGEIVEHGRYLLILRPLLYKIGKLGLKILSKL